MNDLMERQGHPVKLHNLFRNVINLKAGIRPIRKSTTFSRARSGKIVALRMSIQMRSVLD